MEKRLMDTSEIVRVVEDAFKNGKIIATVADDYHWVVGRYATPYEAYVPADAIRYSAQISTNEICQALRAKGYYMTLWLGESSVYAVTRVELEDHYFNPLRDMKKLREQS